jgi:signal peptidase II
MPLKRSLLIVFIVLFIDQALKFWIKTSMYLGQEFAVFGNWFIIHFTENNGMAFGLEFAGEYGKLFLTLFRIAAVTGIGWYLIKISSSGENPKFALALAFIFAGALGNIIDSVFYGVLFSSSEYQLAQFLPAEGGYETLLHGKVVDMFYFPIIRTVLPEWFPVWGGEPFEFFRPVFNVADASISIGVGIIILFQSSIFKESKKETAEPDQLSESGNGAENSEVKSPL